MKHLKILFSIASIISICLMLSITANATMSGDFWYSDLEDGTISVGYIGDSTNVTFPESIDGKKVTEIQRGIFDSLEMVKSVTIPEGVVSIDDSTFSGCENLKNITLPSTLKTIGEEAFRHCFSLQTITLPSGIEFIGDSAFFGCTKIEEFIIPESILYLGHNAFSGCTNLTSVTLPGSLKKISWTYGGDPETITITDGLIAIEDDGFSHLGVKTINLPKSLETIGKKAFAYCQNLESIVIPEGVKTIKSEAFSHCTSLKTIDIPDNVTELESAICYNCSNLQSVKIGNGVTKLSDLMFENCDNIEKVEIGNNVKIIGYYAFYGCDNLKFFDLGNSVETIHSYAFSCSGLEEISIPKSVKTINEYAFSKCTNLKNISLPDSIECIGINAFFDTSYFNDISNWENGVLYIGKHLIISKNQIFGTYKIKDGTLTIADYAFNENKNLTGIIIPEGIKIIPSRAFSGCDNIKSVILPNSITTLRSFSFNGCDKLESIVISSSVMSIYEYAFESCDSLKTVYYSGTKDQFNKINIYRTDIYGGLTNECLLNATIHFNGCKGEISSSTITLLPTCETNGLRTNICVCGSGVYTEDIPATGHNFFGNECNDCGYYEVPNCSCGCHQTGFSSFFYKIALFFWKIFGINKQCSCGNHHYL